MKWLLDFKLVYLASPYSKYSLGLTRAFEDVSAVAGKLLTAGVRVYSPIAHGHPIAIYSKLDALDHALWLPFDQAMMDACNALLVAKMDGWQDSYGIQHEIDVFNSAGKPIYYLDTETLVVVYGY